MGIYFTATSGIQAGLCFVPLLFYQYIVQPCFQPKKEKVRNPSIHMKAYDTKNVKYERLYQQDIELSPLKGNMDVY